MVRVQACYTLLTGVLQHEYWLCIGHIVQLKLKQDGGIRLARQCRMSTSSEVDAEKRKL